MASGAPAGAEKGEEGAEFTIDELANVSQVPSRTIRFYQSKGVLPRPEIRGRVAYYGKAHKARLELIASLQDRGLRIEAIRELVSRIDKGEVDIGEWLGLDAQLQEPWADDRPVTVSESELYEMTGHKRAGLINDLVRGKLVERRGNVFFVPSPALVKIAARAEANANIDVETAAKGGDILKKHVDRAAKDLTALFVKAVSREEADFARILAELRPLALDAVRVVFAQAMERELRALASSGKTARVGRKK